MPQANRSSLVTCLHRSYLNLHHSRMFNLQAYVTLVFNIQCFYNRVTSLWWSLLDLHITLIMPFTMVRTARRISQTPGELLSYCRPVLKLLSETILYFSPHLDGAIPMIQSPPHITSPSVQQSQFNFPSPTIPQNVNALRSVPQASVMAQQQPPQLFLVRPSPPATSEIQPTQIMTSKWHVCWNN